MKNNLQQVRWAKDWSQKQLAMISGVTQSTICAIENNHCQPNLLTALKLAHALSCSVESLFPLSLGGESNE